MSTRYAVAVHRIKVAERSQDPSEQLSWAGNEMASILREGDSVPIELPIAWAGLGMVHKAQHEIAAAFETEKDELTDVEECALYSLKQVILVEREWLAVSRRSFSFSFKIIKLEYDLKLLLFCHSCMGHTKLLILILLEFKV